MPLTRRLILQKARHHTTNGCSDGLTAHGFRYYFTPLPGYFSPFPHGTNPLSVISRYLGLPGGPGRFTADSTSPLLLGQHTNRTHGCFTYRTLTVYGRTFQSTSATPTQHNAGLADPAQCIPTTPRTQTLPGITRTRFSLIHVRSPLLTESQLFSTPTGTEMFHFPA